MVHRIINNNMKKQQSQLIHFKINLSQKIFNKIYIQFSIHKQKIYIMYLQYKIHSNNFILNNFSTTLVIYNQQSKFSQSTIYKIYNHLRNNHAWNIKTFRTKKILVQFHNNQK
jgi:hypothetical protein